MSTRISNLLERRLSSLVVLMVILMAGVTAHGMARLNTSKTGVVCAGPCDASHGPCTGGCVCHIINLKIGGICENP
jgi:hypothetical protein